MVDLLEDHVRSASDLKSHFRTQHVCYGKRTFESRTANSTRQMTDAKAMKRKKKVNTDMESLVETKLDINFHRNVGTQGSLKIRACVNNTPVNYFKPASVVFSSRDNAGLGCLYLDDIILRVRSRESIIGQFTLTSPCDDYNRVERSSFSRLSRDTTNVDGTPIECVRFDNAFNAFSVANLSAFFERKGEKQSRQPVGPVANAESRRADD